jgi:1-acyl-sn-glycerol-3-phosphate acyltransferase
MSNTPGLPLVDGGFPTLPPHAPQVHARWRRWLGVLLMRVSGWRIAGNIPDVPKYVLIVAPHTSNWDFFHGFCAYLVLRLDNTWLAKHTVFFWPLGILARRFGGMPIDRSRGSNVVRMCVSEFARRERMSITITPEGTRSRVKEWKNGFYYIATEAGVPIVPVALNYRDRLVMIMPPVTPTGDMAADLAAIKSLYRADMARHPENF